MITAVDTNILLDIFLPDHQFGPSSKGVLTNQFEKGSLLTRDRGFYRDYFRRLNIIAP